MTAEFGRGMPTPARVVKHAARQRDHVGLARCDNVLGLLWLRDQADRDRVDAGRLLQSLRERHLIAGTKRNLLLRRYAAGGRIDPVDAALFQLMSQFDGLCDVPAALDPVGRRNLDADRLVLRKRRAHRIEPLQRIAQPVLQAATILIGAPIGYRRQELVQQIAVRAVQFETVEAEPLGAFGGRYESVADARKPLRIAP